MSSIIQIGGGGARGAVRRASFLSPMAPNTAAETLDESINGKRPSNVVITRQSVNGRFEGGVQGPTFWLQSKSAGVNPLERRVEGVISSTGGMTEIRWEMRKRSAGSLFVASGVGFLGLATVILVPLSILVDVLPFVGGAGRLALLTLIAGLWALFGVAVWAMRRSARDGEDAALRFLANVLDVTDRDLLGL